MMRIAVQGVPSEEEEEPAVLPAGSCMTLPARCAETSRLASTTGSLPATDVLASSNDPFGEGGSISASPERASDVRWTRHAGISAVAAALDGALRLA